jgi:hypothetical protein
MAKELITEVQLEGPETLETAYARGLNVVVGMLVETWVKGMPAPGKDIRVVNVHLHNLAGKHVGFRFYLAVSEPPVLGPAPVEVLGE